MIGTPKLLISDDDRDFRETLRDLLEPRGFRTKLAADGAEAVQIVEHETIHVVLIDFHMPRMSGPEAIQRIKQVCQGVPCILISASEEAKESAQDTFSVLQKPVSPSQVTETVQLAMVSSYDWYEAT